VVTSAIVKAYPHLTVTAYLLNFTVGGSVGAPGNSTVNDPEVFWEGFSLYNYFGKDVVDANGTAYSYLNKLSNTSYSFRASFEIPGKTVAEVSQLVAPLIASLHQAGIPVPQAAPAASTLWGSGTAQGTGDQPGNGHFASRLFPRRNWDTEDADGAPGPGFTAATRAIRDAVEAGYAWHGIHVAPSEASAGAYSMADGGGGANPAFRSGIMHADLFDSALYPVGTPADVIAARHAVFNSYMDRCRVATPGGGSYVNEADAQEPDWQHSFWGDNYDTLLEIKRRRDPWGLFWARNTVGSEPWAVNTTDGLPTQNGRLCQVQSIYI
jgi:hypothetical protein